MPSTIDMMIMRKIGHDTVGQNRFAAARGALLRLIDTGYIERVPAPNGGARAVQLTAKGIQALDGKP